VGKHSAVDGASPDPIVAGALAGRPADAAHHAATGSPVGWPGPEPEGGGLGWPGDLDDAAATYATDEPAAPAARRGWRRLFTWSRAA
jgi:hypothetical protein